MYLPLFGKRRMVRSTLRRRKSVRSRPQAPEIAMNYRYPSIATDLDFGKRRRPRSACTGLRKNVCNNSSTCKYVKKRGCRRKNIKAGYTMSGNDDLGSYADAAGITFFGRRRTTVRRRRYNVKGSPCNKLRRGVCKSNPNCSYTKRGCRRRRGTSKGLVYQGPSLSSFGRRKARKVHKARRSRKVRKLPKKIVKLCRKLKIKCTKKVGKHRVQRSLTDLKRMIKKRMKNRKVR